MESITAISRDGDLWRFITWSRRRRPLLTALIVLLAPAHTLWAGVEPVDLLEPSPHYRFILPWALIGVGIVARIWGAGNLRKSQEITYSGIYRIVRHPLYLGSLAFFLAYFLTVGHLQVGISLFVLLLVGVYYPTMLSEEDYLTRTFPDQFAHYDPPPRLIPHIGRLPTALSTDRFDARAAYGNLGYRSVWFAIALPVFLRLLSWIQDFV